jgi:propanediol dehydratase small subunit
MTNAHEDVRTKSGRSLGELTMEAVLEQRVTAEDFRISAETLRRQAAEAEAAGYVELGQNLRRAAELTEVSNQEVLDIYASLRPGRTSYSELVTLAAHLRDDLDAPLTAELVTEAAEVYLARGLIRREG